MSPRTKMIMLISGLVFIITSCDVTEPASNQAEVERRNDRILIVDQTGKKWDVTHAVETYGMAAERFQFGIGPFAIRPILEPQMLNPGDAGYPGRTSTFIVIGFDYNGEQRAYPLSVMNQHEVADEQFGNTHVAVAY